MALSNGDRLGTYTITGDIGSGGMGHVYRARDERLGRDVAIKVLPADVANDRERLERFEVEARTAGGLNHPNLVTIYEFGAQGEVRFIAMELVEGETLRKRLDVRSGIGSAGSGGPKASGSGSIGSDQPASGSGQSQTLPVRKALDYARQIALGLAAAHEKGIVHRDLKPENVIVTPDGRLKILDFGLARMHTPVTGDGETKAVPGTAPGTVLGTVGYMAPEQVRGETADHRADLFSLGAVLYEMLSGQRAFQGASSVQTMNAILTADPPDLSTSGSRIPPALAHVVQRCLEKSPGERYQSARDLAFHLNALLTESGSSAGATSAAAIAPRRGHSGALVAGLLAAAAAGIAIGWALTRQSPVEPVRFDVLTYSGGDTSPAASPDGRTVAFSSNRRGVRQIWLKQLSGGGETPRTAGPFDIGPRFSPDGSTLIFLRQGDTAFDLFRTATLGGEERRLSSGVYGADWSPTGTEIAVVSSLGSIDVIDASGGNSREVWKNEQWQPQTVRWSPDGRWLAALVTPRTGSTDGQVIVVPAAGGQARFIQAVQLMSRGSSNVPTWSGAGSTLLYALLPAGATSYRVVAHDIDSGRTRPLFWAVRPMTSLEPLASGTAVFDAVSATQNLRYVPVKSATGVSTTVEWLTRGGSVDRQPAVSPDGARILFTSNRSGNRDLWELRRDDGSLHRVTDDAAADWDPAYTPDGKNVLWSSDRSGHFEIWTAATDGSGARQVSNDGFDAENPSMTPDGAWIVYASGNPDKRGIWKVRPDGSDATLLVGGPHTLPEISPNGQFVSANSSSPDGSVRWIRAFGLGDGVKVPFEVTIAASLQFADANIGRHRWMPGGGAIAFFGGDERGVAGIFVQDFAPGRDTSATRRPLAAFFNDARTESFGILPDGSGLVVSGVELRSDILVARGLPGVAPRARAGGQD